MLINFIGEALRAMETVTCLVFPRSLWYVWTTSGWLPVCRVRQIFVRLQGHPRDQDDPLTVHDVRKICSRITGETTSSIVMSVSDGLLAILHVPFPCNKTRAIHGALRKQFTQCSNTKTRYGRSISFCQLSIQKRVKI